MTGYLQCVHNLLGEDRFEKLKPTSREAVISIMLQPLECYNTIESNILSETSDEVLGFISKHLDLRSLSSNIILTTEGSSYVDEVDFNNVEAIINLRKANIIQKPNKLFRAVNKLLPYGGCYIGRMETYGERKNNIYNKLCYKIPAQVIWLLDFVFNRVIPRIPYLEKFYYFITKAKLHVMSITEVLGRLVYCGFEIVDFRSINNLTYFVVRKLCEPCTTRIPSYYPIIKLDRIGKDKKNFKLLKIRTLHPYSEFLQDYMIQRNGYNDKGKPAYDFRMTRWGRFLRRIWLDELPQILYLLSGKMKLVGLRPLSKTRFDEFPDDLKMERIKYKPGCIPPYVALCMPDEKGSIEAERIYLNDYKNHPVLTDVRYFVKAVYNILSNNIRSC